VRLAYADYATQERRVALVPTALDAELLEAARRAFALANTRTVALRAVGMVVDRLTEDPGQLELWDIPAYRPPAAPLQRALDRIRTRWGTRAIGVGA
jgi:hypothetical protein